MNTVDIITKKRDGVALDAEEIRYMVDGYTAGDIPDYQMSAFLMAVYFQGMNEEETDSPDQIHERVGRYGGSFGDPRHQGG